VSKKNKKEEEFDFITSYLEKVGLEQKTKNSKEEDNLEFFSVKSVIKEVAEIAKKEKSLSIIIVIEVILTILLILMLLGVIPFF